MLDKGDLKNKSITRMVNERLVLIERAFIKRDGLMKKANVRSLAFGPDPEDAYAGKAFPFLMEHVFRAKTTKDADEVAGIWQQAHIDLDILTLAVRTGNMLLNLHRLI
ncbi:N-acetylated-alpha-linked acidic dipeptidase 2-like [Haemaphysalis longicornis]